MKVLSFALLASGASAAAVTPVQKVAQLLSGMANKGKEEKVTEQKQHAAFVQFCDDTQLEKKRAIAEANEAIDGWTADIEKYTSDSAKLTKAIAVHEEDISVWNGDKKASTAVRKMENDDYMVTHQDYGESIDALGRAIQTLKTQGDKPQSLLQLSSLNLMPEDAKRTVDAFLMTSEDSLAVGAPEAAGYETQSAGVIEMLSKLEDKFIKERTTLENEERDSKQAFEMLIQDLTAEIDQATSERDTKAKTKAKKLAAKAKAEDDVSSTTATRDADQKYTDDLNAECAQKADEFAGRQQLRTDEIAAIEKAVEILTSPDVAGSADKHLPGLLDVSGSSLVQLRTESAQRESRAQVAKYLQTQGHKLGSRVLAAIASRVAAGADPFVKVRKLIKDLIVRLMEEAANEAEQKGWCDTELGTNEQVRKEKTDAVEMLHSTIDELNASIAKLTEDLAELVKAIASLDEAMLKATEIRQEEKATNKATIKDAKAASAAVAKALAVLKDFYAKAGEAQDGYEGNQAGAGGVVGMIEVIGSDFKRLEEDTTAAEEAAAKEYDTFMADSKADKAAKEKDIEHKTTKKQDENQALTVAKEDLAGTQKELEAALGYFDKLKPSCIEAGVSYEDRVARRKEEIESLQEALKILQGE